MYTEMKAVTSSNFISTNVSLFYNYLKDKKEIRFRHITSKKKTLKLDNHSTDSAAFGNC